MPLTWTPSLLRANGHARRDLGPYIALWNRSTFVSCLSNHSHRCPATLVGSGRTTGPVGRPTPCCSSIRRMNAAPLASSAIVPRRSSAPAAPSDWNAPTTRSGLVSRTGCGAASPRKNANRSILDSTRATTHELRVKVPEWRPVRLPRPSHRVHSASPEDQNREGDALSSFEGISSKYLSGGTELLSVLSLATRCRPLSADSSIFGPRRSRTGRITVMSGTFRHGPDDGTSGGY
jgi:hypothetical protein